MALTRRQDAHARRALGEDAFQSLLAALHPDRERAAEKYEEIRLRLHGFFTWRGARWPEEMADETIDRVARRLAGGEVIRAGEIGRYFLGVARNVLREAWHGERTRAAQAAEAGPLEGRGDGPGDAMEETRMRCLERCLATLGAAEGDLLLAYYEGEGVARIEARRRLADQLGLPPSTLRIRLFRLRARVEECVRRCLAGGETPSPGKPLSGEGGRP